MKKHVLILFMIIGLKGLAGGFKFPNINYDHAQLYLMNIEINGGPMYADYDVYRNGLYANSKIGDGILLSETCLSNIHNVLKTGIDELIHGLGKCYIPRHGIIYYDKFGAPVASLSICFECDRISVWSVHEFPPFKSPEQLSHWEKAEKQMEELRGIIKENELPFFKSDLEYLNYMSGNEDYKQEGEMFIEDNHLDSLYYRHYTLDQVKKWAIKHARRFELKETTEAKISAGGDKWVYKQLEDEGGTRFIFSFDKENPYLIEATINNSGIILPNGVSVGMSQDEIIGTIGVYDGLANPEKITISDKKLQIEYFFAKRTLKEIKLSFSIE